MSQKLRILYHYLLAKRRLRYSRRQIADLHMKRLDTIHEFARTHAPLYRKRLGQIINKKILMAQFSEANTRGVDAETAFQLAHAAERSRCFDAQLGDLTVGLSSGTSGNRGLFLVSESERLAWCGNILAKVLPSPPWRKQKVALFLRANSTLYSTVNSGTLIFGYFDLLEEISELRQKLATFAPDVLVAPPSMLLLLGGTCRPKRVISVAESLLSPDQRQLEAIYEQTVHQIYQCTEGFLGFTCSHGTLHLNEDLVMFEEEPIDETRFVPIITDLFRTTQPMIRYRLDDVLVKKAGECPCGCSFQPLERIEGRCDDLLYVQLPSGGTKPLFPDFVSRRIITASPDIQDYQVIQTHVDRWEIYIPAAHREAVSRAFTELFSQIGCLHPQLQFMDQPHARAPGAKLRRIQRKWELPH